MTSHQNIRFLFSTGWRLRLGRLVYSAAEEKRRKEGKLVREERKQRVISLQHLLPHLISSIHPSISPRYHGTMYVTYSRWVLGAGFSAWLGRRTGTSKRRSEAHTYTEFYLGKVAGRDLDWIGSVFPSSLSEN